MLTPLTVMMDLTFPIWHHQVIELKAKNISIKQQNNHIERK